MIAAIHQPQYFPWLGYFHKILSADVFILLDNVQFKKNDWQNRNKIKTPQGPQWLTVPVLHDFGQKISEVRIDNRTDWRSSHLKSLKMNYAKAPYFKDYMPRLESILERSWESLSELNIAVTKLFADLFGIRTKMVLASDYQVTEESTQRLVDLCRAMGADGYLAGADGHKYMDLERFGASGIKLLTQEFRHPVYNQCWPKIGEQGFLSHMAAVDLLFNRGPESLSVLRGESAAIPSC